MASIGLPFFSLSLFLLQASQLLNLISLVEEISLEGLNKKSQIDLTTKPSLELLPVRSIVTLHVCVASLRNGQLNNNL